MVARKRHLICGGAAIGLFLSARAEAQLAGSLVLDSDYRLRGYSLTHDQPALTGQVSYDDPSGLYVSVSGLTELGTDTRFLGVIANAGYAERLNDRVTLDGGVLRYQIGRAAPGQAPFQYSEIYAGAYVGRVTGRIYYSPDYRSSGLSTLYGELEATIEPARNWRLSGHVGILTYLSSRDFYRAGDTHQDWRIAISRQLGKFEIHSALSGGRPYEYSGYRVHKKVAATVGATLSF